MAGIWQKPIIYVQYFSNAKIPTTLELSSVTFLLL